MFSWLYIKVKLQDIFDRMKVFYIKNIGNGDDIPRLRRVGQPKSWQGSSRLRESDFSHT